MSVDKSMDDNKIKEKIKFLWNEIKCNIIGLFYYFPLHLAVFTGIAFSLITFQLLDSFFFLLNWKFGKNITISESITDFW